MVKVLSVASVLALAGAASAAPFTALTFEASNAGGGVVGDGFTTSGAGFYNRLGATNTGLVSGDPLNWFNNDLAADSYFGMSGSGPSRFSSADGGVDAISATLEAMGAPFDTTFDNNAGGNAIFAPDSHIGMTSDNDGQLPSSFNPNFLVNRARAGHGVVPKTPSGQAFGDPTQQGVFIAQFTVNRGAVLSGNLLFNIAISVGVFDGQFLEVGGPAVSIMTDTGPQLFKLTAYKIVELTNLGHSRSGGNLGTGTGSAQRFGDADVLHLWVETVAIPTPGALALLGIGGLVTIRRRRA